MSGRWFHAPGLSGPWSFLKGGQLPPDFGKIPDDSEKENVKARVPGTPQAAEAIIAATIPQTAEVNRAEAKITKPRFDGSLNGLEERLLQKPDPGFAKLIGGQDDGETKAILDYSIPVEEYRHIRAKFIDWVIHFTEKAIYLDQVRELGPAL